MGICGGGNYSSAGKDAWQNIRNILPNKTRSCRDLYLKIGIFVPKTRNDNRRNIYDFRSLVCITYNSIHFITAHARLPCPAIRPGKGF